MTIRNNRRRRQRNYKGGSTHVVHAKSRTRCRASEITPARRKKLGGLFCPNFRTEGWRDSNDFSGRSRAPTLLRYGAIQSRLRYAKESNREVRSQQGRES